jgi:uncharacterized membrane protein
LRGRSCRVAGLLLSPLFCVVLALPAAATEDGGRVVRAVLFVSPTCPHCRKVLQEVLPPLVKRFQELQVGIVSTATPTGRDLYWAAHQRFAVRQRGVPLLVIGDVTLVGSDEIPQRLPDLVESYLAQGGVGWPDIPGLTELVAASSATAPPPPSPPNALGPARQPAPAPQSPTPPPTPAPAPPPTPPPAVAQSMPTPVSPTPVLPPAARPAIPEPTPPPTTTPRPPTAATPPPSLPRPTAAPPPATPAANGGTGAGEPAAQTAFAPTPSGLLALGAGREPGLAERVLGDPRGNGLAILVLAAMAAAVLRSLPVLRRWRPATRTTRLDWANPLLALAGLGVATYLAHVEVHGIEAVCGPVGDCNTVQQSEYARLFGVLPIGVLGAVGFAAIVVTWAVRRWATGRNAMRAALALLALTALGTLFSIYLTFLEPFVIGATCLWCLTSAVIMTALYGLALAPANAPAGIRRRTAPHALVTTRVSASREGPRRPPPTRA